MTKLNDTQIRSLKPGPKTVKLSDGLGLYLVQKPAGGRYWHFNYRFAGKQRTISFGTYSDVSLKAARDARSEARTMLVAGQDPSTERKKAREAAVVAANAPGQKLWREVAEEYSDFQERQGKAPKTLAKIRSQLAHTIDDLAQRPIAEITPPELITMVKKIEADGKLTTATQTRELCGRVFRYAMANGYCLHDPTPAMRGALLPPKLRHYPGLTDPKEVGKLVASIWQSDRCEPVTKAGLLMLAYTFQRPGEIRNLHWDDVSWDDKLITIPAERMKGKRKKHLVPLTERTLGILDEVYRLTGRERHVFAGPRKNKPLSDAAFGAALGRIGYTKKQHVQHGFRTTASTSLNEAGWNRDWIERQLSHVERDSVRRAYNAAEYLDGRRDMMQAYSDLLVKLVRNEASHFQFSILSAALSLAD